MSVDMSHPRPSVVVSARVDRASPVATNPSRPSVPAKGEHSMNGRILTAALACAATAAGVVALEGSQTEAGAAPPRPLDIVLRQSEAHVTMVPGSQHPAGQQGQSPGDIVVMNGPVRDWGSGRLRGQVDATFTATR